MNRDRRWRKRAARALTGAGPRAGPLCAAILLAAGLLAAPARSPRAAELPSPEQLLAAAIHAGDAARLALGPGGWWDDAPEFDDRLDPAAAPERLDRVAGHLFGKPDNNPAELTTSLAVYATPAASAADFTASAAGDEQEFGGVIAGPKVGDRSRYRRQFASSAQAGGAALRFQFGRYLVRIDAGGEAATITPDALAALARLVIARLSDLDAGRLKPPPLPDWTAKLPPPDREFPAILGTAAIARDAGAWVWSSRDATLETSPRLRGLLHQGVGGPAVIRRYAFAARPEDIVELTLVPFGQAAAATAYLGELLREDPRRTGPATQAGEVTIYAPIPDVAPGYRTDFDVGTYAVSIACYAPFAPTSAVCLDAVRDLALKLRKRLPAAPP